MRKLLTFLAFLLIALPLSARGRSSTRPARHRYSAKAARPKVRRAPAIKCVGCERDSRGRIKRSSSARKEFVRSHPCPATGKTSGGCPGYVIDHVVPLKRGGADRPSNMQWQTKAQAKAKDRIE